MKTHRKIPGVEMTNSQSDGFIATPSSGKGPGVLVLHAWWGLNETIKDFCRRLAEVGFSVFAPDLYHGSIASSIAEAQSLGQAVDRNHLQTKAEIARAAQFLSERSGLADPRLAVIGFSLGAYYAVHLAALDPGRIRSVVLFYGTGDADLSSSQAAFLGHFADQDEYEPPANVDAMEGYLRRVGRPVEFYRYPQTKHWFFEPDRLAEYEPAAAQLAWERTLAFLEHSRAL
jgi:carboxymethylenebutenolidase